MPKRVAEVARRGDHGGVIGAVGKFGDIYLEFRLSKERFAQGCIGRDTTRDKDFLRARESYLTEDQKATYADVFAGSSSSKDSEAEEEAPKSKKSK